MSGITTQFAVSASSISAPDTAKAGFGSSHPAPRVPSETAFFRGLIIAAALMLPFWIAASWFVYQAL